MHSGVKLIKAEEALEIVLTQVTELRDEKAQHDNIIGNIEKVSGIYSIPGACVGFNMAFCFHSTHTVFLEMFFV